MASTTKRISYNYEGFSGNIKIENQTHFKEWLAEEGIRALKEDDERLEGDEVDNFSLLMYKSEEPPFKYTRGRPSGDGGQEANDPKPQSAPAPAPAALTEEQEIKAALVEFFDGTDLKQLDFEDGQSSFIKMKILDWSRTTLHSFYWRQCYSFILCATIAYFEKAFEKTKDLKANRTKGRSLVLTGTQGTGKSLLGSIIGLVIAKAFGWHVKYTWNGVSHSFGPVSEKHLHIVDFSMGDADLPNDKFVLYVTSANKARWQKVDDQETFEETLGQYIFIDVLPKDEIIAIGAKENPELDVDVQANYVRAGGVARLCVENTAVVARKIDKALHSLKMVEAVEKIEKLNDDAQRVAGESIYPGLVGHIHPTDPLRNHFTVQPASSYVKQEMLRKLEGSSISNIEKLMNDLLTVPKGRGFGGLIWEPLFSAKVAKNGNLIVVGRKLPTKDNNSSILLQVKLADLTLASFKSLDECKGVVRDWLHRDCKAPLLAKAIDDNFETIDGILFLFSAGTLTVIGLQMTVAQESHGLKEKGLRSLVDLTNFLKLRHNIGTASTKIWFLQPEQCLTGFAFTSLQPVIFDQESNIQQSNQSRKRRRDTHYPKQSNKKSKWPVQLRGIDQYVTVAKFDTKGSLETNNPGNATNQTGEELRDLLNDASSSADTMDTGLHTQPSLRTWESTIAVAKALRKAALPTPFIDNIDADLLVDQRRLREIGFCLTGDEPAGPEESVLADAITAGPS